MNFQEIIDKMTLEEKIKLCSGADYWNTEAFSEYGIPSIRVNDGPHGLRIQKNKKDNLGINESLPSTCFPTACMTGSSWDRELIRVMGEALAEESIQEGTAVLLGPGINIKRNPLCGRNFEYFSEDPFLSGELGAAWINGIQGRGVGASLKHFAANSQENHRLCSDSIIDERSLREIYLAAFENAVKTAGPATVMCAYNLVNGTYCSDNKYLLTDILRGEWGFQGVVISDWGATNDRIAGFKAGMDLEMPGSKGYFDKAVASAVKAGDLSEQCIDQCVDRLLSLIFTCSKNLKAKSNNKYNIEKHHELARKIAGESAVLLKNDKGILPLDISRKTVIIGELAQKLRYQGTGSSRITPHRISNVLDGFDEHNISYNYYKDYDESVKTADYVIIAVGLTDDFESEGFDRNNMELPESHIKLIDTVAEVNQNIIILLFGGSPVTMPWIEKAKAVLNMYLPGQAGGLAVADILTGKVNPSGKLAETYPLRYEDVISSDTYGINPKQVLYKESLYVGYRYYEKAGKDVLFPFGFGLSYTEFTYSDISVTGEAPDITVGCKIKNTGKLPGAEIVQLYVGKPQTGIFAPNKELKDFEKVYLQPGEDKEIKFELNNRSFSYYDIDKKTWIVQNGQYSIKIGASSKDIRLEGTVKFNKTTGPEGTAQLQISEQKQQLQWYYKPEGVPSMEAFEALSGYQILPVTKKKIGDFDLTCTISEMMESRFIRLVYKVIELLMGRKNGGIDYSNPNFKMMMESAVSTPIKNLILMGDGLLTPGLAKFLVLTANGHFVRGILTIMKNEAKTR